MRHYLDHAATSALLPAARDAFVRAAEHVGNPSSLHTSGRQARHILEEAREELAAATGAHPTEVIWTSGGTEADNLAVLGGWQAHRETRPRVVVSEIEHPAIGETTAAVRHRGGVVDIGRVRPTGVISVDDDVWSQPAAVVSVMSVNNETGVIQPLEELAAITDTELLHTDAVQAFGHIGFDFAAHPAQLASITAHKIGGPVGIGALLARKNATLRPTVFGGRQERALRSGTLAPALAAAFAAAATWVTDRLAAEAVRLATLRDRLEDGIAQRVEQVRVNGADAARSPAISNMTFAGCRSADLLLLLDAATIDCSSGSACHAGVTQPSDVLLAMGLDVAEASGSLRFSLGWSSSDADIDAVLGAISDVVARARIANEA